MRVFTIGFTKKSAEQFFSMLSNAGVRRVIDVRLHNESQLAGFAKRADLKYLLKEICGIEYVEAPFLAPTDEILRSYRKKEIDWGTYEARFNSLISERGIENLIEVSVLDGGCLLCSEDGPELCHRRLVAEYLKERLGNLEIIHLQ
jgi:uncharacterized protein (DUF488 family)